MQVIKIPSDRLQTFENKYNNYVNSFGTHIMQELFVEVRYGLFRLGYKIDSMITVYYLLFYVFNGESDASKWNVYRSTNSIIEGAESKIFRLQTTGKLIAFPS